MKILSYWHPFPWSFDAMKISELLKWQSYIKVFYFKNWITLYRTNAVTLLSVVTETRNTSSYGMSKRYQMAARVKKLDSCRKQPKYSWLVDWSKLLQTLEVIIYCAWQKSKMFGWPCLSISITDTWLPLLRYKILIEIKKVLYVQHTTSRCHSYRDKTNVLGNM